MGGGGHSGAGEGDAGTRGNTGGDTARRGDTLGLGGDTGVPGGPLGRGPPRERQGKGRMGHRGDRGTPGPEGGWSKGGHTGTRGGEMGRWEGGDPGRGSVPPGEKGGGGGEPPPGDGQLSPGLPAPEHPRCDAPSLAALPVPRVSAATSTPSVPRTHKPLGLAPQHPHTAVGCPWGLALPGHCLSPGAGGEGKEPVTHPGPHPNPPICWHIPSPATEIRPSHKVWGHPDCFCPLPKASTCSKAKGLHSPCSRYSSKSMAVSPTSSSSPSGGCPPASALPVPPCTLHGAAALCSAPLLSPSLAEDGSSSSAM